MEESCLGLNEDSQSFDDSRGSGETCLTSIKTEPPDVVEVQQEVCDPKGLVETASVPFNGKDEPGEILGGELRSTDRLVKMLLKQNDSCNPVSEEIPEETAVRPAPNFERHNLRRRNNTTKSVDYVEPRRKQRRTETEEEAAVRRAIEAERQRIRRSQLTPEEREKIKAQDAERQRNRRRKLTGEELTRKRALEAERRRKQRQREQMRAEQLMLGKDEMVSLGYETLQDIFEGDDLEEEEEDSSLNQQPRIITDEEAEQEFALRKAIEAEKRKIRRNRLTPEEQAEKKALDAERKRLWRSKLTGDELTRVRAQAAERRRKQRSMETFEDTLRRREGRRKRYWRVKTKGMFFQDNEARPNMGEVNDLAEDNPVYQQQLLRTMEVIKEAVERQKTDSSHLNLGNQIGIKQVFQREAVAPAHRETSLGKPDQVHGKSVHSHQEDPDCSNSQCQEQELSDYSSGDKQSESEAESDQQPEPDLQLSTVPTVSKQIEEHDQQPMTSTPLEDKISDCEENSVDMLTHWPVATELVEDMEFRTSNLSMSPNDSNEINRKQIWDNFKRNSFRPDIPTRKEEPSVCELCGKKFRTLGFLNYHYRVHRNERKYLCEVCGKTFAQASGLQRHRTTHDKDHTNSTSTFKWSYYKRQKVLSVSTPSWDPSNFQPS